MEEPQLYSLAGVKDAAELTFDKLERLLAATLELPGSRISVLSVEDGEAQFVLYPDEEKPEENVDVAELISSHDTSSYLNAEARAELVDVDEEEEEYVDEETAMRLWREDTDRTSHLPLFPSPDGVLNVPCHHPEDVTASCSKEDTNDNNDFISPTHSHLKRDPTLLEFDNVPRIEISQLGDVVVDWTQPIVIVNDCSNNNNNNNILARKALLEKFSDVEVRTGNRETLAENGFVNSQPMTLGDALKRADGGGADPECSRIVFSPVHELPEKFRDYLSPMIEAIPSEPPAVKKKHTLVIGSEGFGIGFHRHNAAMFYLNEGRKKWYLGPQEVENDVPTHPGFYKGKSSHKVIQKPGEVLFVPENWYHEIFNLEFTAGIQALPDI
ncbi:hypothetical protein TrLO_g12024 [Triparma laevis f. longispina]|uniref:JmjC domain-containing protein n=1 Tax=Triparma laevis f. longispina TaxID=1714387 RepID=A0A9W7FSV6_9STRA|nr:hypothetical protein TrLO_g12024 [Triparma laevis f. longispina]